MIVFGDNPELNNSNNIEYIGLVDNREILKYLKDTKFSIVSDETPFSFLDRLFNK